MHEMAIAVELVNQVLRIAAENRATRVDVVEVDAGALRRIEPEALQLAFTAAADGTLAAQAELRLTIERVVAVCRGCECMYLPDIDNFVCPQCGAADARIVAGNDIILKSLVCQATEGAPVP